MGLLEANTLRHEWRMIKYLVTLGLVSIFRAMVVAPLHL
jgi:hypothetical protein